MRCDPEVEEDMLRRVRVRVRVPCLEPTWCTTETEEEEEGEGGGGGVALLEPATGAGGMDEEQGA